MSHEDDLEKYPGHLKKWNRQIKVFLFCVGVVLACLWAATVAGVI